MKHAFIICLLFGLGFSQSSQHDFTAELLKDLNRAISDSLACHRDSLYITFTGKSALDKYLNARRPEKNNSPHMRQISLTLKEFTFSINRDSTKSMRNPGYLRQLELSVLFLNGEDEFAWQGKLSDRLSKVEVKTLLQEDTPFEIRGNYASAEPAVPLIILTTAGVFALGAALFFIRT
jgi:hypothetical protein